jgi:predicted 5'-methylthioadenosine/S-adenosylhomocysteine nucleosidase
VLIVAATERELAHVRRLDTLCCGVGPVEAAVRTAAHLAEAQPDAVLHVGIAGARTLAPLTVVLGSESIYCDVAAAIPVVDRVLPDAALLERCRSALADAHVLPIGTSAAVGGGTCDVEAMEGFGVLRACELADVPAVEIRVVANSPDESDRGKWRFEEAFELLGSVLDRLYVV